MNETSRENKKAHTMAMLDREDRLITSGKKMSNSDRKFMNLRKKEAKSLMNKIHNRDHNNTKYNIDRAPFDHLRE